MNTWNRIRSERKKKGLTLAQVARQTGYSVGYISQLERDQKQPSLAALRKIAGCLGCSEVWLIMGLHSDSSVSSSSESGKRPDASYVMKKENRVPMKIPELDTEYSIFTPSALPLDEKARMTGLFCTIKPGCWVSETMILHQNMDEAILLLKGRLEVHIADDVIDVNEGDSFYVPQNTLHNYLNTGTEDAVCISFFSSLIY